MTAAVKGKGSVEFLLVLMGLTVATYVDSSTTLYAGPYGKFSEVDTNGPQGMVVGSTWQLTCNHGYHVRGDSEGGSTATTKYVKVERGDYPEWNPSLECVRNQYCDPFPDVPNGRSHLEIGKTPGDKGIGSAYYLTCDPHYHLEGTPWISRARVECVRPLGLSPSYWTPEPKCVPDPCSASFFDAGSGKVLVAYYNDKRTYDIGSKHEVRCDAGYHIEGKPGESQASFECSMDVNGMPTWTPQPKCVA